MSGPSGRLFVGGLSGRTGERELDVEFSKFGRIRDVVHKGNFAFVVSGRVVFQPPLVFCSLPQCGARLCHQRCAILLADCVLHTFADFLWPCKACTRRCGNAPSSQKTGFLHV